MAPAIDDNCLTTEFKAAAAGIGAISVLASKKDSVLSVDFPLGNFFAGIIAEGHPWWRAALGHCGPAKPWPANFQPPFEIPDDWKFEHGNYLQIDQPEPAPLPLPVNVPPQGTRRPQAKAGRRPSRRPLFPRASGSAEALFKAKKFIAFSSPFASESLYAGFATQEVAGWTFKKN